MKVIIFDKFWTIEDTKKYKDYVFIFGDNNIKKGTKGQAVIRHESNAYGIPTKKYPSYNANAYYTDLEYDDNITRIDDAINNIVKTLQCGEYKGVVLPKDGLGTGLADLKNRAPKTFMYLTEAIKKLIKFDL